MSFASVWVACTLGHPAKNNSLLFLFASQAVWPNLTSWSWHRCSTVRLQKGRIYLCCSLKMSLLHSKSIRIISNQHQMSLLCRLWMGSTCSQLMHSA